MILELTVAAQQLLRAAADLLAGYRCRARAWRELQALDHHALRDIGLSHRAAAERWHGCLREVGQEETRRDNSRSVLHARFTQAAHHSPARVQQAPAQAAR
jgi:uncharacterized protein YjiS (DUF1127 family)